MGKISYSSAGFVDRDIEAALDAIAAAGFDRAEVLGQEPHVDAPLGGKDLQEFRNRMEGRGLLPGTVHAPLTRNVLAAPEEDWRRERVVVLGTYIRFAAELGCSGIVIHPVPNPQFVSQPEGDELTQTMRAAARRSLDDLVPVAEEVGIRMLLENLPYKCTYPFLNMTELRSLVDPYPDAALGLVIDTGHAWTGGHDPAAEILAAGERLWGTHLQDVDYDDPNDNHWMPTEGGLDWAAIRSALGEVGYTGHWTYEVIKPRHDETPEILAKATRETVDGWGPE